MSEARNKRRIGVVTTSRADYSHLYWPLRELAAHPQVELGVFALGAHLSPLFGSTIHQIERDGFPIRARIECLLSSDTDTGMAKTIGLAIAWRARLRPAPAPSPWSIRLEFLLIWRRFAPSPIDMVWCSSKMPARPSEQSGTAGASAGLEISPSSASTPNKQITTGEGGAVLVRIPEHAATIRRLRNQGRDGQGWLDQRDIGYNYRLSELECALGRVQLRRIAEILAKRRAAAQRYHPRLKNIPHMELPPLALPHRTVSWFVYVVRVTSEAARDRMQAHLAQRGIATGRYFAPIHLQPPWRTAAQGTDLRLTEKIACSTLALPLFNRITLEQQEEVIRALCDVIQSD